MRLRPQARFEANRRKAALRPRGVQDIPPAGLLRAKSLAPLGCATHGTAVPIFGTVNGTFLLHKRKVGLRERPSHRDAVKTPNNWAEAVTVFSVACGAVLSTDGKYRAASSYKKDSGVELVSVSRTWCVLTSTSGSVVISSTHSSNPTFSFRPAEKKTCR